MKMKTSRIGATFAAIVLSGSLGFTQNAACPPEGFSRGFSTGCPQIQFANPADISAMMAAMPDKPYATPRSLRRVLVLARAAGWVHTSIPLAAKNG